MLATTLVSLFLALVSASSDSNVRKQQKQFIERGGEVTEKMTLFRNKKAFRAHTPELFREMTSEPTVEKFVKLAKQNKLFEEITAEDIEHAHGNVCAVFGGYIDKIPESAFKHITESCLNAMMLDVEEHQVKKIPTCLLRKHPNVILAKKPQLHLYKDSQIKVISGFKDACKLINAPSMRKLKKAQWKQVAPQCFADIPGIENEDLSKNLVDMRKDIFSYMPVPVENNTFAAMSAEHVRLFGSKCRNPKVRGSVNVMMLNKDGATGVSAEAFRRFVRRFQKLRLIHDARKERQFKLRKVWTYLPKGVLGKCRAKDEMVTLAKMLDGGDLKYMTADQINELVRENPKVCKHMPANWKLPKNVVAQLKISAKCFANLPKSNQVSLLSTSVKLDDNLLGKITYSHAKKWPHGLNFLNKIKATNVEALIQNLSRAVEEDKHVCRAIKNVEHLKGLKVFREFMPKGCWDNLGFKVHQKDVVKYPLLFAGRKHVLKNLLEQGETFPGKKLSQHDLLRLTKDTGEECSAMGITALRQINGQKLSGLSPTCIACLPCKKDLMPEEIQYMGPKAFSMITRDTVADLRLNWLLNDQLENLSSAIEDISQVASVAFTISQLADLTEERLRFLQARLWSPMDPALFSIFKDKQAFAEFPGVKMIYWTPAQVNALPRELLYSLNVDQATQLGSESQDAAGYQQLFDPVIRHFEPAVQEVLATRFACQMNANTNAAAPSSSFGLLSATAVALITTFLVL
jgi:hypothetical protein